VSPVGDFIHVAVIPSVVPVVIHMQNISVVYKIQFAFRSDRLRLLTPSASADH